MKTVDVINFFKKKSKIAEVLGVGRSAISQWGDYVPVDRQYELEVKTGGQLKSDYSVQKLNRENNERKQQQQP